MKIQRMIFAAFFVVFAFSVQAEIELTWNDNSDNEDGFQIERDEGAGFVPIARVDADQTTYVDKAVKFGIVYRYRVNAYNEWGYSGFTNVAEEELTLDDLEEVETGSPPNSAGTLTAGKLARGLEAFASALREDEQ